MIIWETLMFWNGQLRLHQKDSFMEKEMKAAVNLQPQVEHLEKWAKQDLEF
jgi:hypothetical protein